MAVALADCLSASQAGRYASRKTGRQLTATVQLTVTVRLAVTVQLAVADRLAGTV